VGRKGTYAYHHPVLWVVVAEHTGLEMKDPVTGTATSTFVRTKLPIALWCDVSFAHERIVASSAHSVDETRAYTDNITLIGAYCSD